MANMLERNKKIKPVKKTHMEHMEDALYREVWEEVNNEKTLRFVKKYSKHIMVAALSILIVATGIQIGIRTHNANKIAAATAFEAAAESMDANALAAMAENNSGAMADLAMFQAYMIDKDIAKLEKLANDANTRDFGDLAKVHVVAARGDTMTAAEVEKYLRGTDTKNSPYYYTARLMVAQKYLAEGDRESGIKILDKIVADKDAPADILTTAESLR